MTTEAVATTNEATATSTTADPLVPENLPADPVGHAPFVAVDIVADVERVSATADHAGAASVAAAIAARSADRRPHPASLTASERHEILELLCSDRFADLSPAQVFMTLLDEDAYHCSVRSMYRLLEDHDLSGERRRGAHQRPGAYPVPIIEPSRPNGAWSWDITKLRGPSKGVLYYLYTILDMFSRKVVGWTIALRESAVIAEDVIRDAIVREGIERHQLTLHADRGGPMIAGGVAELLLGLGVTKSHSRPRVSNENVFFERFWRSLKYENVYLHAYEDLTAARQGIGVYMAYYNSRRRHTSLGRRTPDAVYAGEGQGHVPVARHVRNSGVLTQRAAA